MWIHRGNERIGKRAIIEDSFGNTIDGKGNYPSFLISPVLYGMK
jgi:hypothetical protein